MSGGWRLRVVVLAFIGSRLPCPLGRGIMCGLRGWGRGYRRGSPYIVARRRVISSSPSSSPHGLLASLPPRRHLPRAPCASFSSSLPLLCLFPPPCSRVVSYRSSPRSFDEPGGAVCCLLCLPALRLLPLVSRLRVSVLACPACDRPPSSSFPLVVAVASARVSSSPRLSLLPVLRQAWAGSVSARSLLAHRFALVLVCGVPRRAGGVRRAVVCLPWDCGRAMWCCRLWLCSVCGVVVCIYKLNACSCIMDIVERESD